ncbi:MAG: flavodoxin family protein [Bacillota bacterium]
MTILAIQSSPNEDGLTATLARTVLEGAQQEGARTRLVNLNSHDIQPCRACGTGWGHHFAGGGELAADQCVLDDDFANLRDEIVRADGLVFSSPVYFWDLSESAKVLLDRLRRSHYPIRATSPLNEKPMVCIAAAGGSGNGAVEAAVILDAYFTRWMGMRRVATLPVTRQTREMHVAAARQAGRLLVQACGGQPE